MTLRSADAALTHLILRHIMVVAVQEGSPWLAHSKMDHELKWLRFADHAAHAHPCQSRWDGVWLCATAFTALAKTY